MDYITNDLIDWILDSGVYQQKIMKSLKKGFNNFVEVVKIIIKKLNNDYGFLNFKINQINLKDLYNYFINY